MRAPVTSFKELTERLIKLEREWDQNLIDDKEMDHLAAKAVQEWASWARAEILGGNKYAPWTLLQPGMRARDLGYLPGWLDLDDPRSAKEQIHSNYKFGGWRPFKGSTLKDDNTLCYPGDRPLKPRASAQLRDELILLYPSDWVVIVQPDRTFEVARID